MPEIGPSDREDTQEYVDDDDATEDLASASTEGPASASNEDAAVFISHRLEPDESTAIALRRLLEGCFDPPVRVFVSGAGGLRPDSTGLTPQLQKAVQAAKAFVAIITPASKDREWIIFEAGAAWGRGQLYAPLLIDTKPEELGTTIGHYVATRADSREKVEMLARSIASVVGTSLKSRFGKRYAAFQSHLEKRADAAKGPSIRTAANSAPLARAIDLWFKGEREESRAAFKAVSEQAANPEEAAQTTIVQLSLENDPRPEFLAALENLNDSIKATTTYASWRAMVEDRPDLALELLRQVRDSTQGFPYHVQQAVPGISEKLSILGREVEGTALLMEALRDAKPLHRPHLVSALLSQHDALPPLGKLALLCVATSGCAGTPDAHKLTNIAIEQHWPGLAIFVGRYRSSDDGTARNNLGRAYFAAGLLSMAYEAYQQAISAGVSVAKTNIAALVARNAVPAAGLLLLREHQGDFDSSAPDFPFRVRAEIEELVDAERKRADALFVAGRALFFRIAELAERSVKTAPSSQSQPVGYSMNGNAVTFGLLVPFAELWAASITGKFFGLFVWSGETSLYGLKFDPANGDDRGSWITLHRTIEELPQTEQPPLLTDP